jgi:hypothetical protein
VLVGELLKEIASLFEKYPDSGGRQLGARRNFRGQGGSGGVSRCLAVSEKQKVA